MSQGETARAPQSRDGARFGGRVPYFLDPALKQRLDLLQHLTEYADLLLVVKGPHGVGKTALLHQLLERARDHWMACEIDANPLTTRDQMLSEFGEQLGLDLRGIAFEDLQSVIEERLAALQRAGRVVLLIVDDAHALAVPVLDLIMYLFGLRGQGGKLVRVLLFAEPVLDETLRSPALRSLKQQVTHTLDVPPLSLEQTGGFLEHYFRATGQVGLLPLAPAAVQQAYSESAGNPAALLAAAKSMQPGAKPDSDALPAAGRSWLPLILPLISRPRMLLVAGVALVLVLALVFQGTINEFVAHDDKTMVQADGPGRVPLPLPVPGPQNRVAEPPSPPPVTGRLPQVEPLPEPVVPETPPASEAPTPRAAAVSEPEPASPPPEPLPETVQPDGAEAVAKADPGNAVQAPEPTAGTDSLPPMLGRSWLESRPADHYTLQLMGVRDQSALAEFVRENRLENNVAYWRTTHKGGEWHVLLYGDYADREAAAAARAQLVRTLRDVKPWPRSFAGIQDLLRQQR